MKTQITERVWAMRCMYAHAARGMSVVETVRVRLLVRKGRQHVPLQDVHGSHVVPAWHAGEGPGMILAHALYGPRATPYGTYLGCAVWIEHALSICRSSSTVGWCGSPGRTRLVRPRIFPAPRGCHVLLTRSMAYGPKSTYRSIRGLDT